MPDLISDNEWAAEWLGCTMENRPFSPYPGREGMMAMYVKDGKPISTVPSWKPDSDLNQFKLVLDAYTQWWLSPDSNPPVGNTPFFPVSIRSTAWYGPSEALKLIRKAVEHD